jgi:hypothetical protein
VPCVPTPTLTPTPSPTPTPTVITGSFGRRKTSGTVAVTRTAGTTTVDVRAWLKGSKGSTQLTSVTVIVKDPSGNIVHSSTGMTPRSLAFVAAVTGTYSITLSATAGTSYELRIT